MLLQTPLRRPAVQKKSQVTVSSFPWPERYWRRVSSLPAVAAASSSRAANRKNILADPD